MEGQVSVFMSSSDRVALSYPQALGSISITFYNSQGYGRGILTPSTKEPELMVSLNTVEPHYNGLVGAKGFNESSVYNK
jgi:hypothetical protein